jgi:mRNA-degrading endonuclease RelE of RelBE toxin-antitoxin system
MKIVTTETFDRLFLRLSKKIQRKATEKTQLFQTNPFHPSLRVEKLHPKQFNVWSFRIDIHYRIVFKFIEGDKAAFLFIGHHNEIYDYDLFK